MNIMLGFRRKSDRTAGGPDNPATAGGMPKDPDNWSRTIVDLPLGRSLPLASLSVERAEKEGTRLVALDEEKFKIRLATTEDRRESASLLIQKMYSWRGYSTGSPLAQRTDPNRITLVAGVRDAVIGTLTIGFDSPAGLLADEMYKEEIDKLRANGAKIGELIKLAADRSVSSMRVLAALFHLAYIYGRNIHGLTDAVIEVTPSHAAFYQKVLGFERIGAEKLCPRVNVHGVLLRLGHEYLTEQIRKFGGQGARAVGERTLYPFFFSPEEEAGITQRLLRGH